MSFTVAEMEERAKAFLLDMAKNFKIFLDSCSLLSHNAEKFWEHLLPILQQTDSNVVIPFRVYEEVVKYANDPELCRKKAPDDPELNHRARHATRKILKLHKEGRVRILGDKNDNFADNVFQTVFTHYRMNYHLLLITQDRNLAVDILQIAQSKSVHSNKKLLVRRINKHGFLSMHENLSTEENAAPKQPVMVKPKRMDKHSCAAPLIPENERFALADKLTAVTGEVTMSVCPKEGDTLTAIRGNQQKRVSLINALSSGGEGTVYTTDIPDIVAKIYKPDKVNKAKLEKLRLMMTKNINCEGVCFPTAMLYNHKDEFVGYLMKLARGKELQKSLFVPQLFKKRFPNWKKKDTVQLCLTILEKFKYLHDRNIILGDINPNNILVVSPTEVYFVDTDSYQIEGFPCPVGTINFTAPEIQRKKFNTFLRTMGNEQFAVATLLFMIMLPGKPPYSLQGGDDQVNNIINGDFAYASGERTNGKAPEGVWRYIWSHLPRYLKDDFYETFHKDGAHNAENNRFSDDDWIKKFELYAKRLADENGAFLVNDPMSAELFPTRLKKNIHATYVKCRMCGCEVVEEHAKQGYCNDCLSKGEPYQCARCKSEMVYTNYHKLISRSPRRQICKTCNDALNAVYKRYRCANPRCGNTVEITVRQKETLDKRGRTLPTVCPDCNDAVYATYRCSCCGTSFSVTYGEKEYYDNKGYELPKKCTGCRGRKTYGSGSASKETSSTSSSSSSSWCFITTAVCEYFNKPDDCYELTALRCFRDNWLAVQPGGKELVKEYYAVAPAMVDTINRLEDKDAVYTHLWADYIEPCIELIERGENEACKNLYVAMVEELKTRFSNL